MALCDREMGNNKIKMVVGTSQRVEGLSKRKAFQAGRTEYTKAVLGPCLQSQVMESKVREVKV